MKNALLIVCSVIMLFSPSSAEVRTERYVGYAVDLKTGKPIYTEEHEAMYENDVNIRSVITYRDVKNNVIGKKEISFRGTSPAASFRREDFRFGTVESAEPAGSGAKLVNKQDAGSAAKEEFVDIPAPMAIDAGLNNLVRNHWDALANGETVNFNLGVPSQLDYFSFRLLKVKDEIIAGKKASVVRFESDHWYIRLFVDPVIVWYDAETRRAVRYEGISNIYNEQGKSYQVRVTFDKPGP